MELGDVEFESTEFNYKERKGKEVNLPATSVPGQPADIRRGNLFIINNTYGFIVAGTEKGTPKLHNGGSFDAATAVTVQLPGLLTCLSLSSDGLTLAAAVGRQVLVFDVPALHHSRSTQPKKTLDAGDSVVTIAFAKASKTLLAVARKEKPATLFDLASGASADLGALAAHLSWCPAGSEEELAIVLKSGSVQILAIKGTISSQVKTIPEQTWEEPPFEALFVDWFSSTVIAIGYRTDMGGSLVFIDLEKNTALKAPLEIADEFGQYYTLFLSDWNLLLVTTTTQGTVEVYGPVNGAWAALSVEDDSRAVFPVSPTGSLCRVVGLDMDLTCNEKPLIDAKSEQRYPPTVAVAFLTDIGRINSYSGVHPAKAEGYPSVKPGVLPIPAPAAASAPSAAAPAKPAGVSPFSGDPFATGFGGFGKFGATPGGMFAGTGLTTAPAASAKPPTQPEKPPASSLPPEASLFAQPKPLDASVLGGPAKAPAPTGPLSSAPLGNPAPATKPGGSSLPPVSSLFAQAKPLDMSILGGAEPAKPPAAAAPKTTGLPTGAFSGGPTPSAAPAKVTAPAPALAKSSMPPDTSLFGVPKPIDVGALTGATAPLSTAPLTAPAAQSKAPVTAPAAAPAKTAAPAPFPSTGAAPAPGSPNPTIPAGAAKAITSPTSQQTLHAQFEEALLKFRAEVSQVKKLVQTSNTEIEAVANNSSKVLTAKDLDALIARTDALCSKAEALGATYKDQYKAIPTLNIALVNCWSVTENVKQYIIARDEPEYLYVLANRPLPRDAEELRKRILATKESIDLQITTVEEHLEKLLLESRQRRANPTLIKGRAMAEPPTRMLSRTVVNIMTGIASHRALVDSLVERMEKLKLDVGFQPSRRYSKTAGPTGKSPAAGGRSTPTKPNLTTAPPLRLPISAQSSNRQPRPSRTRLRELKSLVQKRSASNKIIASEDLEEIERGEEETRPVVQVQPTVAKPAVSSPSKPVTFSPGLVITPKVGPTPFAPSAAIPFNLGVATVVPPVTAAPVTTQFTSFAPMSATVPPTTTAPVTTAPKVAAPSPAPAVDAGGASKFQRELAEAYKRESTPTIAAAAPSGSNMFGVTPLAAPAPAKQPITAGAPVSAHKPASLPPGPDFDGSDDELAEKPQSRGSGQPTLIKTNSAARKSPTKPSASALHPLNKQSSGSIGSKPGYLLLQASRGSQSNLYASRSEYSDDDGSFDQLDEEYDEDDEFDDLTDSGDDGNSGESGSGTPTKVSPAAIRQSAGRAMTASGSAKHPAVVSSAPVSAPAAVKGPAPAPTTTTLLATANFSNFSLGSTKFSAPAPTGAAPAFFSTTSTTGPVTSATPSGVTVLSASSTLRAPAPSEPKRTATPPAASPFTLGGGAPSWALPTATADTKPPATLTTEQKIATTARTLDFAGAFNAGQSGQPPTAAPVKFSSAPPTSAQGPTAQQASAALQDRFVSKGRPGDQTASVSEEDDEYDYSHDTAEGEADDDDYHRSYPPGDQDPEEGEITDGLTALATASQPVGQAPARAFPAQFKQPADPPKQPGATGALSSSGSAKGGSWFGSSSTTFSLGNTAAPFGAPAAAPGQAGSAAPFGSPAAASTTATAGPFGQSSPPGAGPFGAQPAAAPFGQSAAPTTAAAPFGAPSAAPFGQSAAPTTSAGPFGAPQLAAAAPFGQSAGGAGPFAQPSAGAPAKSPFTISSPPAAAGGGVQGFGSGGFFQGAAGSPQGALNAFSSPPPAQPKAAAPPAFGSGSFFGGGQPGGAIPSYGSFSQGGVQPPQAFGAPAGGAPGGQPVFGATSFASNAATVAQQTQAAAGNRLFGATQGGGAPAGQSPFGAVGGAGAPSPFGAMGGGGPSPFGAPQQTFGGGPPASSMWNTPTR